MKKHHTTNKNKHNKNKTRTKAKKTVKTRKLKKTKTRKLKKTDLKDNFYYYVNNSWFSNTFISSADSDKTRFTILQKK